MGNTNLNTNNQLDKPHELIWGQLIQTIESGRFRNIIAISSIEHIPMESPNFHEKAMTSLDALFSIASISGNSGLLPRFQNIQSSDGVVTVNELNPYQLGHNIDYVANGAALTGNHNVCPTGAVEDYRFITLKGPLVIHGWGYDTNGYPIPNEADTESNIVSGIFNTDGLTENFISGYLHNPKTWPVGPVDIRFDKERGVWVAGGSSTTAAFCDVLLLSDLYANGLNIHARVLDDDGIPTTDVIAVNDKSMAGGAYGAGSMCYVEQGVRNWVRGGACVVEMEP